MDTTWAPIKTGQLEALMVTKLKTVQTLTGINFDCDIEIQKDGKIILVFYTVAFPPSAGEWDDENCTVALPFACVKNKGGTFCQEQN